MQYVSGEILTEDGFQKRYIGFEKNKIVENGKIVPKKPICEGFIIPSFVNAHIHIGDSFIRRKNIELPRDVEKLVGPPDGLKHRLLKQTDNQEIIEGMKKSIDLMNESGTSFFCDFREGGINGIGLLKTALQQCSIKSMILSRPNEQSYNKDEMNVLLENSDGIGFSAISDWDYTELVKISKHVKKNGKIFAFHASERSREDIDLILDLKPDFLIHMIYAIESDLIRVKENNIPLIICPRSNMFFGLKPNYKLLRKVGIKFMIGTDNCMINSPNILDEINFILKNNTIFPLDELLINSTYLPRKVLNLSPSILGPNPPTDFLVLDKKSLKPLYIPPK